MRPSNGSSNKMISSKRSKKPKRHTLEITLHVTPFSEGDSDVIGKSRSSKHSKSTISFADEDARMKNARMVEAAPDTGSPTKKTAGAGYHRESWNHQQEINYAANNNVQDGNDTTTVAVVGGEYCRPSEAEPLHPSATTTQEEEEMRYIINQIILNHGDASIEAAEDAKMLIDSLLSSSKPHGDITESAVTSPEAFPAEEVPDNLVTLLRAFAALGLLGNTDDPVMPDKQSYASSIANESIQSEGGAIADQEGERTGSGMSGSKSAEASESNSTSSGSELAVGHREDDATVNAEVVSSTTDEDKSHKTQGGEGSHKERKRRGPVDLLVTSVSSHSDASNIDRKPKKAAAQVSGQSTLTTADSGSSKIDIMTSGEKVAGRGRRDQRAMTEDTTDQEGPKVKTAKTNSPPVQPVKPKQQPTLPSKVQSKRHLPPTTRADFHRFAGEDEVTSTTEDSTEE